MTIPKTIYFCNKTLFKMEEYSNNWKILNPEYEIVLYDDKMCEKFLLEEYSEIHKNIFIFLIDGPIKADFWRICILNKYGGVYSDIDNEPLIPLKDFIEKDIDFATCTTYCKFMELNYNPNFIISKKNNIILEKCIDWYINNYLNNKPYEYWNWSIMRVFTDVLHLNNDYKHDGIFYSENLKIQIIKECPGRHHYDAHNIYNKQRVFNNRYSSWDHINHCFYENNIL